MAIHNPSTLYSAGDVKLDSSPYLRIAMAQKARDQAANDALYKYYAELPTKLNSAGVRAQDREGLNKRVQDISDFFQANSKDILKWGVKKQELDAMYQGANSYVNQSKDTGKFQVKTASDFFTGKHRPRGKDLEVMAAIERPIDDPTHYKDAEIKMPYGYNDFSIAAAPYSSLKQKQFDSVVFEGIKPEIDKSTEPILDNVSGKMYNTYRHKPENIYKVGQRAAQMVQSDPTMFNYYEDLLTDPDAIATASKALSKVAGVKVEATTPQQLAAGLAIEKASVPQQQEETNQELVQKRKKELLDQRQAFQRSESAKRRAQSEKNANIIAAKWETTDPYKTLQDNIVKLPTKEFDQTSPFGLVKGKDLHFAPFTGLSENEIQDMFGQILLWAI